MMGSCVDFILRAADLVDRICVRLASIGPRDRGLFELSVTMASIERLIHSYILQLLADCGEAPRPWLDDSTLSVTAARLKALTPALNTQWKDFGGAKKEGGVNSLLFYLIATLELCFARIREADEVLCGKEAAVAREKAICVDHTPEGDLAAHAALNEVDTYDPITVTATITGQAEKLAEKQAALTTFYRWGRRATLSTLLGAGCFYGLTRTNLVSRAMTLTLDHDRKAAKAALAATASYALLSIYRRRLHVWRLRTRLQDSRDNLQTWSQKWILVTSVLQANNLRKKVSYHKLIAEPSEEDYDHKSKPVSRRLLECVPLTSNKGAFWYSQGALRLLLVRRAMDLVYASIGTALEYTGDSGALGLWVPLAGCAATYYALAGPEETSICAAQQVMDPSMAFIKRAWGLVASPPVKWLTTQASKVLRGLRIAERVYIRGVPCLILSKRYRPELQKALDRYRKYGLRAPLHCIHEADEHSDSDGETAPEGASRRGTNQWGIAQLAAQYDVILHVTGGGWFIHTTATDVPFLSEWSGTADAVVVLPEYDLMPEHRYPVAITEIYDVYKSLMDGSAAQILGFRPRKIVVSGESAGGNMAAALCVKLCIDGDVPVQPLSPEERAASPRARQPGAAEASGMSREASHDACAGVRMPDGLMLSCPSLNVCRSVSPSRIMGAGDPVLPSGVLQMIAESYAQGFSPEDPCVSPYFAPDEILKALPPVLTFVSAVDPLLDDAVDFNTRIRRVGGLSELKATHHVPHAFWGLGSIGFPEVKGVHQYCEAWLLNIFGKSTEAS
eukprot:scaffold214_cov249-Pinguiococcus_pyrenoidosus.AAC.39